MIQTKRRPQPQQKKRGDSSVAAFARYTNQVTSNVLRSIKMAGAKLPDDISPIDIVQIIKDLGTASLTYKPETLFSAIDEKYHGWTADRVAKALERFHDTGVLDTEVSDIVRQKFYSVRIILTSDTAHTEWHIFEKVGAAFNGRLANFGTVEPLDPIECARTISFLDSIRPDKFSNEIKAYIAAACHEAGLYTIKPSRYLGMADQWLEMLNREATSRPSDVKITAAIESRLGEIKKTAGSIVKLPEDFVSIQATRLLAIDVAGDDAVKKVV